MVVPLSDKALKACCDAATAVRLPSPALAVGRSRRPFGQIRSVFLASDQLSECRGRKRVPLSVAAAMARRPHLGARRHGMAG
jgi:hypothetical protein